MTNPLPAYPKRLIEVDLPIARISVYSRKEKAIRHGHISSLHIWWARRPLAACRAVICAALWPDPADELCPSRFRKEALRILTKLKKNVLDGQLSDDQRTAHEPVSRITLPSDEVDFVGLRTALLTFIGEFANWDLSTNKFFLEASRSLTQLAHDTLGGATGTRPLVIDPFAGGGAIPLESLRVGTDVFASDLNPVAVLLNKVLLEYVPQCGNRLAEELHNWGGWVKEEAAKALREFYPKDPDGSIPITYIWARTIVCEGPGCGATVPLIRSLWMSKRGSHSVGLKLVPRPRAKRIDFEVIENAKPKDVGEGTVRRGSVTCPICGYTTPVASIRRQLNEKGGGAADAQLCCVVTTRPGKQGRFYRTPTQRDLDAIAKASAALERQNNKNRSALSLVPDETLPLMSGVFNAPIYGHTTWGSLFSPRQALALTTFVEADSGSRNQD
jgi:adenine-specific DNA methylase